MTTVLYRFVRPSFVGGMARALDLSGQVNLFRWRRNPAETDAMAIHGDWSRVGDDLRQALTEYEASLDMNGEE